MHHPGVRRCPFPLEWGIYVFRAARPSVTLSSIHSEGGRDEYPECRQIARKAGRSSPDAQEVSPRIEVPEIQGRRRLGAASHGRVRRRAKIRSPGVLTVERENSDDPIERDREHAAALGLWFVYFAFVILGTVWFLLFRQ
ncbi:hypothetical protein [Sphingopyxis sp.]|uniref:hypothetical protein n=1 Tax=Sphingopyxis sp. TaxID=1908224 RepID=UPI002FC5B6F8